ncbi:MAG TPA: type VI secretion system baseplate subunit TssF [Methylocella sp.]|nr:type VI secretion system baseplate subunit TssF [Methylocella sp.]
MDQEFLDHYNRELKLLYEHVAEFAQQYPGVAERLGGLIEDRMDPMVAGLLEGAAFLAARVQLKLKHEFPEFTNNLLEQLVPDYLAPTPSVILVGAAPPFGDAALRDGQTIPRGSYFDATYRQLDRQVACRFQLTTKITLLPFDITRADYFASPGALQALGVPAAPDVLAGLRLSLRHRSAARLEDEPPEGECADKSEFWFSGIRIPELPVQLLGQEADAIALYEQIFGNCVGLYFRYLDEFGDPAVIPASRDSIKPIGFQSSDALFPRNERIFSGFDLLREYFVFPRKFLGFRLTGLGAIFARLPARSVDVVLCFDEVNSRLQSAVKPAAFSLYSAAAVNLFEKTTDRIQIKANRHEHHVVPDRSRYLDYEPHRILSVQAHYPGGIGTVPVQPLYSSEAGNGSHGSLYYTVRRMPRGHTAREKKYGLAADYVGTDMFVSLVEPAGHGEQFSVAELSIRALCSNRHLTEHLPVGQGGADFRLLDNVAIPLHCLTPPTPPRGAIVSQLRSRDEKAYAGSIAWRLINLLSLNHLGLVERGAGRNAQALREVFSIFADLRDSATERRIRGVSSLDSRPVVRRLRQRDGVGVARGVEVTVTIDERAYEGSGIFLLGAVLDHFFCEYAGFNHFTETVIRSLQRGEIMRWPVRVGSRRCL